MNNFKFVVLRFIDVSWQVVHQNTVTRKLTTTISLVACVYTVIILVRSVCESLGVTVSCGTIQLKTSPTDWLNAGKSILIADSRAHAISPPKHHWYYATIMLGALYIAKCTLDSASITLCIWYLHIKIQDTVIPLLSKPSTLQRPQNITIIYKEYYHYNLQDGRSLVAFVHVCGSFNQLLLVAF